MKKAFALILICCVTIGSAGCSSGSSAITEDEIQAMIDKKIDSESKKIKEDILNDISKSIDNKIDNLETLTPEEKVELKDEILGEVNGSSGNGGTNKTDINKYYITHEGDVYKSGDTYNTEKKYNITNVENITNESDSENPPKITDGTEIEIQTGLPVTCTVEDDYTLDLTEFTAKAYNYEAEPYMGQKYPYRIEISYSGTVEYHPKDESEILIYYLSDCPVNIIMNPYQTEVACRLGMEISYDTTQFSNTFSFCVNELPEYITLTPTSDRTYTSRQSIEIYNMNGIVSDDGYFHGSNYCNGKHISGEKMNWTDARKNGYKFCTLCNYP